ncbi:unnamed protein product, partial [Ectocarpus sp. 8 AP-2014]
GRWRYVARGCVSIPRGKTWNAVLCWTRYFRTKTTQSRQTNTGYFVIFARAARNRSEFDGLCWEGRQRRRELRRGRTATT